MDTTLPPPDASTYVPPAAPATPRLVRPATGRKIGGVCAAIADRFGWDRTVVRVVALVSILLPGPQVIAYLVGWIVIPADDEPSGA